MTEQEDLQSAIEKIQSSLVSRTDSIIKSLPSARNIDNLATQWVEYANQLNRLVPDYAIPGWLTDACSIFGERFRADRLNLEHIAAFLTKQAPNIHQPILIGEAATLDLEQLFSEQSERFNLNQVFENLVSRLSELIAADVVDNRIVHESLKRLNALFRRTKNGSLSAVLLTMNYGRFFLNSFGGILKANRYAKPIIENFEDEFSKASEIVQEAEEETKKEMVLRLINRERMELFIEANPDLKDTVAGFLPAPRIDAKCEQDSGGNG